MLKLSNFDQQRNEKSSTDVPAASKIRAKCVICGQFKKLEGTDILLNCVSLNLLTYLPVVTINNKTRINSDLY